MLKHIKPGTLIYKFLDRQSEYFWPTVLDILTRHQIYLNSRNNFNDPYDSRPIVEGQISLSNAQKYTDLMFANPSAIYREPEETAEIERLKGLGKTRLSEQQVLNISQGMRAHVDEFIDKCGISCFSLEAKESLLWAHYAGGFSGICIAFKRSASKSSAFSVCAEVVYVDERPRMSIDLFYRMVLARQTGQPTSRIIDEIFFQALFHKSRSWAYEREARIYFGLKAGEKLQFDPSELVAIILAPKAPISLEDSIRAAAEKLAPSVTVVRASLSADGYHIIIPDYSSGSVVKNSG